MEKFTTLTSIALPLPLANVDTDMIYPGRPIGGMKVELERSSDFHGRHGFANLRYRDDGAPRADSVFGDPRYKNARILLALDNFGCGSSREMAVWALVDMGFRCVLAPSFGDIFFANACLNGLLPVRLPRELVERAIAASQANPRAEITVDLDRLQVTLADASQHPFELDEHRRQCLLQGLDDIGYTLTALPAIERFEREQRRRRPWLQR